MNQDDFDRFLAWLNPDREEAGKKYEKIRRRIITICRAHSIPEIDAEEIFDEIINRVVRKLPEIIDTYNGDPALYFYGVARNVIRERWRPIKPPVPSSSLDDPNYKERRDRCLEHCLEQLALQDRRLLLDYYSKDGREKIELRRQLADKLGISENALRIRLSRLRATLKECMEEGLKQDDE